MCIAHNFRKHLLVLSSVLIICFLITSCINDDAGQPSEVSKVIGPQGGTLASADDKLSIDIPQGIMESATKVTITAAAHNENPNGIGTMFSIDSDVKTFGNLVTLKFRYDDNLLNGAIPELLTVSYRENGGAWKIQPNAVLNKSDKSIIVKTNHFSQWTLSKGATGYIDITSPEDTLHINLPIYRFTNKNGDGDAYSDSLILEFGNRMAVYGGLTKIGTFEVATDTAIDMELYVLTYDDLNPGNNIYIYSGPVSVIFTSMGNQSGDVIGGNFEGTIERVPDKKPIFVSGKFYFQIK